MANPDGPIGFQEIDDINAGGINNLQPYYVDASNASRIGNGDPITAEADGGVARSAAGDGVSVVAIAKQFKNSNGESIKYLPASTAGTIMGLPVKGRIFQVQADSGTSVASTSRGATADFVAADCDTTTGISNFELDSDNIGTGNQCRVIDKVAAPNNDWGEHVLLKVVFVEDAYSDSTSI